MKFVEALFALRQGKRIRCADFAAWKDFYLLVRGQRILLFRNDGSSQFWTRDSYLFYRNYNWEPVDF